MAGRQSIGNAPNGEDSSADGTEKIPVSGSKWMYISTIAAYIRTLTQTLTGKTINLTDNTLTGTKAQFNTAMSDADFATIAGSETLTSKTLTAPVIADFTAAQHDHQDADDGGTLAEAALALTDITTNNASTTKHGFLKKLDNTATNYMDGTGNWSAPAGGSASDSFKTIAVSGQSDVVADSSTDTLTLVAGSNVTITTNAGADSVTIAASGGGTARDYILIREEQAQNTGGGTFTSGSWQTRVLNTEVSDTGGHATLASNQITLAAGTYEVSILCPAYGVNRHQARLQNVTDATTTIVGMSFYMGVVAGDGVSVSAIKGKFTIAGSKAFEVQHQCQTTKATNGFGAEANFTTEVYTIAELWKVA